jgi:hypothetical protein
MEWLLGLLVVVLAAIWARRTFGSFWAQKPGDYADDGPLFDIKRHMNGPMTCHGVIYGPMGRVVSRFSATMQVRWQGDHCVMEELFTYDSGATQTRTWQMTLQGDRLIARAEDLQGEGDLAPGGLRMRYRFTLPQDAGGHTFNVRDWMYLVHDGSIVNRSEFRKFGIKVLELVATIHPARP